MSSGRAKISQKISNLTSGMLPDKKLGDGKIEEEDNDDDEGEACNISEGLISAHTPSPRLQQQFKSHITIKENCKNHEKIKSSLSGAHTRTNSSKA